MSIFTGLISSDFKQYHIDMITELISGCAIDCTIVRGVTLYDDCANCWEYGTPIKTDYGYKNIEDVSVGQYVDTGNKKYNKVLDNRSRIYNGDLYNISSWGYSMPYKVTSNHKFPIVRNFRSKFTQQEWYSSDFILDTKPFVEEVEAKNIRLEDAVIIPYSNHPKESLKKWHNISLDSDFLFLLGWWIAEGCLHIDKYTRSGSFCLCASKEEHIAFKLQQILKDKFNVKSTLKYRSDADNLLVTWYSSKLTKILKECGHLSYNKKIPDYLWKNLSLSQKTVILLSYTDGDGNRFTNKGKSIYDRMSIVTTSEQLALQVHNILVNIGYYPSINWKGKYTDKNGLSHARSFVVTWCRDRIQQKSNVRKGDIGLLSKVRKITVENDTIPVCNLEVENIHKYIAGGCLTNNCVFDPIGNKSSNRYQTGGPAPFTTGACPMCFGEGKIPNEQTQSISLAIIYDYKSWIPTVNSNVRSPNGFIQTLSVYTTIDDLRQAKELRVDTDNAVYTKGRFERHGEPEPCGLGSSSFVVTMWKRIENG